MLHVDSPVNSLVYRIICAEIVELILCVLFPNILIQSGHFNFKGATVHCNFVSPRISLLYGHVNTHVLELANQMTGKDERERAWTGAVSCAQFSDTVPANNLRKTDGIFVGITSRLEI